MDGEVNDKDEIDDLFDEPSKTPPTYAEYFKTWFPFYLNCGMTYDQYWVQSSELVIYYHEAYTLQRDEKNFFAWLTGLYVYAGHSAALSNFGAGLGGKKGNANYLEEPVQIRPETEEEIEAKNEAARRKFVAQLNKFHARMESKKDA